MDAQATALREAWRLFRSDERVETYLAVGLVAAVVVIPVVWREFRRR